MKLIEIAHYKCTLLIPNDKMDILGHEFIKNTGYKFVPLFNGNTEIKAEFGSRKEMEVFLKVFIDAFPTLFKDLIVDSYNMLASYAIETPINKEIQVSNISYLKSYVFPTSFHVDSIRLFETDKEYLARLVRTLPFSYFLLAIKDALINQKLSDDLEFELKDIGTCTVGELKDVLLYREKRRVGPLLRRLEKETHLEWNVQYNMGDILRFKLSDAL